MLSQIRPNDVAQVSGSRRPRFWRCRSSGGGCGRPPICCMSLFSLTFHGKFNSQELGCHDDGDTRIRSYFLPELLHQTIRIATSDSVKLQLLRRHLLPLWDPVRCLGAEWDQHQPHHSETHCGHRILTVSQHFEGRDALLVIVMQQLCGFPTCDHLT